MQAELNHLQSPMGILNALTWNPEKKNADFDIILETLESMQSNTRDCFYIVYIIKIQTFA